MEVNTTRLVKIVILGVWLMMVALLVYKNSSTPSSDRISFASVKDTLAVGEEWMGIYLKEEKVGYAVTITQRKGDSYEIFEHALMHLTMMGKKQRIESRLKTFADVDFRLKSFDFTLSSGPVRFSLQGEVTGKRMHVSMLSGKQKTDSVLELAEAPYLSNSIKPYVVKHGLEVGKAYLLPFFDPSTMSSSTINVEVIGKEEIIHSGNPVMAYQLKESFKGIETLVWVSETGETLKEESPLGLSLLRETQEVALSGEWMKGTKPDLVLMTAIPITTPISNPRQTKLLTVKIDNVPVEEFDLQGGRQRLEGSTVKVRQEDPSSWETFLLPAQIGELKQFMQPSPLIQSGDAKIMSLAARITKGTRDAEKSGRMLLEWVYTKLEKKPTMSIPSALEVLDLMAGDCNEHTALFTALARSLGMPTRICVGVVCMRESFYYHAWPEIFLGSWVAVDPTFNQFPADATHIRFVVGDLSDQIKILKIVSQIKLEVLEYS